jgi:hypothetical protein
MRSCNFLTSACFSDVTSATITWNTIYVLVHLLGISNRSSFHQCPMECILSFKNGFNIEVVPNACELFRNTANIQDNDCAMIYCT